MKLYNTLSRSKEEFIPLNEKEVKMYVCGPTVYNFFHIGNARTFLVFDTVRRYLEYKGYKVNYVQNFTDIDDKMIKKANEENTTVKELGDRYINEFYKDSDGLNIKRATSNPRATEFMDKIIAFIKELIDKEYAYTADGDVYFSTKKSKDYGKLWGQNLEDLLAGSRINIDERKKDPSDFALWKAAKKGEPSWETPWGKGRPGWHIECSCMAHELLGETIDIHAGGADLIFPHHTNEIVQSESKSGKTFAKYWMHSAYLNINNEKMSKSLNNFFTTRDILEKYDVEVVRLFMMSGHYRTPLNFSMDLLNSSKSALERMYNAILNLENLQKESKIEEIQEGEEGLKKSIESYKVKFIEKMDDDFNTADAVSIIFDIIKEVNIKVNVKSSREIITFILEGIRELGGILGILQKVTKTSLDAEVEALIEKRQKARKSKDFATADRIRDELTLKGITLLDTPQGVRWTKK